MSLSPNGFSLDLDLKVQSPSSTTEMTILEVVSGTVFKVAVLPSSASVNLYLDTESYSASSCSALQSKKRLVRWSVDELSSQLCS